MKCNIIVFLILSASIILALVGWLLFPLTATILYCVAGAWIAYEMWTAPHCPEEGDE